MTPELTEHNKTRIVDTNKVQYPKYTIMQPCRYGWFTSMINDVQTVAVAFQGDSLPDEGDILCSFLKPGQIAIDVGASFGSLSMALASAVGTGGRVFAFEPQTMPYQCLVANIITNSLSHIVTPMPVAIGKECGEIQVPILDPISPNFGGCSLVDKTDGPTMVAPMITIDSFELPACHLLKIDVEGMEADALRGAYQTIAKHRPILWVEHLDYISWRNDTKAELIAIFEEHDYEYIKVHTPTFSRRNIRRQLNSPFTEGTGDQNVLAVPAGTAMPDFSEFHCATIEFK